MSDVEGVAGAAGQHWDAVYATKPADTVSWFQEWPDTSLRLLTPAGDPAGAVIDVGAGRSPLAGALLTTGWSDVTVLDVSAHALEQAVGHLAEHRDALTVTVADLLTWTPPRAYQLWHDRAVFHFLVDPADRDRYLATARRAVATRGALVLGTFGPDGPTSCSGLPTARYDAATLAGQFAPDFALEHFESEQHTTPAGVAQPFTWVVLRRAS